MDILVVQHVEADPVGILGHYLEVNGAWLHTWLVPQRSTPPQGDYAGLIVLGGPMNACEDQLVMHWVQSAQFTEKLADTWYDQVVTSAQAVLLLQ